MNSGERPMALDLTAEEIRVLGCLVEKQATTPDNYPLSSNSLMAACNQSTSRDPIVDYSERTIDATMLSLRDRGLARTVRGDGQRVHKHRHVLDEAWSLQGASLAVVSVLMLRGAQTVAELRARTERYAGVGAGDDVDATLRRLAEREPPFVQLLPRRAGEREARWIHLVGDVAAQDRHYDDDGGTGAPRRASADRPRAGGAEMLERVDALEAQLAEVNARLEALTAALRRAGVRSRRRMIDGRATTLRRRNPSRPRTAVASAMSPSSCSRPCASASSAVQRPHSRALKVSVSRVSVAVGVAEAPIDHRGATIAHFDDVVRGGRARHRKCDDRAVGSAGLLSDDESQAAAMQGHDRIDDRTGEVTGASHGAPHVLFVHPAVEEAHDHEPTVGNLADRAPTHLVEVFGRHGGEHAFSLRGHLVELREYFRARTMAPQRDGVLVEPPDLVLHVRGILAQRRIVGKAEQPPLDGDEVTHVVAHRPTRAVGCDVPLGRRDARRRVRISMPNTYSVARPTLRLIARAPRWCR